MNDPVAEVKDRVDRIIEEHEALWGCDDPSCAVMSSTWLLGEPEKLTWWQRLFRGWW